MRERERERERKREREREGGRERERMFERAIGVLMIPSWMLFSFLARHSMSPKRSIRTFRVSRTPVCVERDRDREREKETERDVQGRTGLCGHPTRECRTKQEIWGIIALEYVICGLD